MRYLKLYQTLAEQTADNGNLVKPYVLYTKENKTVTYTPQVIDFKDAITKKWCVDNFDTDKDGELSYSEAKKVKELPTGILAAKDDGGVLLLDLTKFHYDESTKSYTDGTTTYEEGHWAEGSTFATLKATSFDELKYFTNLETIRNMAFTNCTSLSSVTIPNSVTTIGNHAFTNCTSLSSVTIPNSVTTIGEYTFTNCTSLSSVTIPNSVTTIGTGAFSDCTSLSSVTIPNSVTTIGNNAFYKCTSLSSVTIPNSVTTIGTGAFSDCTSLSSVTIPNSVTTIGEAAFYSCTSLSSVTIPNSVTTIGNHAFYKCTSLSNINFNGTIAQWKAITKGTEWNIGVPSTTKVTCTDGQTTMD